MSTQLIIDAHYHLHEKEHWNAFDWEIGCISAGCWRYVGDGLHKFKPVRNVKKNVAKMKSVSATYKVENVDELINRMDREKIDYCVCAGLDLQRYWNVHIPNDWLAKQVSKYPDRLIGLVCLDSLGGKKSVFELRHYIKDMGMKGLKILPSYESIDPADDRINPLYEESQNLNVIVQIHCGMSFGGSHYYGMPILFDRIGSRFPDLKIQLVHMGFQSYYDVIMLMLKHPNFWGDLGAWYAAIPTEELIRCLKLAKFYGVIDKIMWASDNRPSKPEIERLKSLPKISKGGNIPSGFPDLTNDDINLVLGLNAKRLYDL